MSECEQFTAYCGLYCQDCIPSDRELFALVRSLRKRLEQVDFDHYAALKSRGNDVFGRYADFAEVLSAIGRLQCARPCREGGGKPQCQPRACCQEKGYAGCWECGDFQTCSLLQGLRNFHGDNINHNLRMIREHGIEGWADRRGKHYPWSK